MKMMYQQPAVAALSALLGVSASASPSLASIDDMPAMPNLERLGSLTGKHSLALYGNNKVLVQEWDTGSGAAFQAYFTLCDTKHLLL